MIASVSGVVKATTLNSAVIEVGGVGIQVSLPARFAAALVVGTHADIFTTRERARPRQNVSARWLQRKDRRQSIA